MGDRTKIDWCDASWNPVTGCLHGCEYCYARDIATRFKMRDEDMAERCSVDKGTFVITRSEQTGDALCVLYQPYRTKKLQETTEGARIQIQTEPYPVGFNPTFHRYRLDEPKHWRKPRNIFVCSMADLCGEWVPDSWKQYVISACKAAPRHRYLFLTKNPYGYTIWGTKDIPVVHEFDQDNFWIGCSMTGAEDITRYDGHYGRYLYAMGGNMIPGKAHRFISIEPILTDVMELLGYYGKSALKDAIASQYAWHMEWVIIGAETGRRKGKVVPKREWIDKIVEACRKARKPVFMKESLREIMGADFVQEFPWEVLE